MEDKKFYNKYSKKTIKETIAILKQKSKSKLSSYEKELYEIVSDHPLKDHTKNELMFKLEIIGTMLNSNPTEREFYNSFFSKVQAVLKEQKVLSPGEKFQLYVEQGRFGFTFYKTFERDDYEEFKEELTTHKADYDSLHDKLSAEDKKRVLKSYFLAQLEKLKKYQKVDIVIEDIDEVIKSINKPQQSEDDNPYSLLENEDDSVFADKLGYTLFNKLHDNYKNEINIQANYSYIFIVLKRDKYIICRPIDFINFILKRDIQIDKIDIRQFGKNFRDDYYLSIRDTMRKMHNTAQ